MATISVIDYGMGNIHSVAKALQKVSDRKDKIYITSSIKEIKESSHIVFPGQGAAKSCMSNIRDNFDLNELRDVFETKFFLGICMGLQVLMTESDEGNGEKCLNIFTGKARYLGDFQNTSYSEESIQSHTSFSIEKTTGFEEKQKLLMQSTQVLLQLIRIAFFWVLMGTLESMHHQ